MPHNFSSVYVFVFGRLEDYIASMETLLPSNRIIDFPDHHIPFAHQTVR